MIRREHRKWWKFGAMIAWLVGATALLHASGVRWSELTVDQVRQTLLSFGPWSPAVYFVAFAQPLIPLPGSLVAMAGGLAFGIVEGAVLSVAAGTVRACGQFLIARALGREAVEHMLRGHLAHWDRRIGRRAFLTVLLVRIVPSMPFDIQNLALGVSQVPFSPFLFATAIGLVPSLLLWVYLGHTLTDMSRVWQIVLILIVIVSVWLLRQRGRHRAAV